MVFPPLMERSTLPSISSAMNDALIGLTEECIVLLESRAEQQRALVRKLSASGHSTVEAIAELKRIEKSIDVLWKTHRIAVRGVWHRV
jgi:TnpA family transposase